jgi:hypothetical protein
MQGLISQSLEGLWTVSLVAANKRDGAKVLAEKGFQQELLKTQRRNYSQKRLGESMRRNYSQKRLGESMGQSKRSRDHGEKQKHGPWGKTKDQGTMGKSKSTGHGAKQKIKGPWGKAKAHPGVSKFAQDSVRDTACVIHQSMVLV